MATITYNAPETQDDAPWPEAPEATRSPRQVWREAVQTIAERAKQTLPECHGRVDKAVALVLNGDVELLPDGHARVASASNGQTVYRQVNGSCACKDYEHAPSHWCKHRIAAGIAKRAGLPPVVEVPEPEHHEEVQAETVHGIPREHIVTIQGKPFVKVAGLLALAHQRGLQSLRTTFTYNDAELALAESTAVFPFGTYTDVGDACEKNVNPKVKGSFRRVAATRATARALRNALNVGMVAVEELED